MAAPIHVAAYEESQGSLSRPSVKQHLAALKMLFDWLVIGSNPAQNVRGPNRSHNKAKTPGPHSGRSPRTARQYRNGYAHWAARSRSHWGDEISLHEVERIVI